MSDLVEEVNHPENWTQVVLTDCAMILDSKRIPLNNKQRAERVEGKAEVDLFPYYGATGKVGVIDDFIFEGEHLLIGEDGAPFFDKRKNVAYLVNGKFWVNNHAHILNAYEDITTNQYLLHFLNSFNYKGYVGGTTRLKLNQGNLKKIPVPLAPLSQQKRIVAKIEELFSHIDAGIAALNQSKQLLKQYRQSVLKAAVTGELTKQWREENKDKLEPASELLARILIERRKKWEAQQLAQFKAKGKVPKNDKWKEKYKEPITETCLTDTISKSWLKANMSLLKYYSIYGPRFSSNDYSEDGIVVLRTTDINERGKVKIDNAPKLNLSDSDYERYKVESGDLLITRTGSIGTLAIFNDSCEAIPGAYLLHYKFIQDDVIPLYIYLVFKSPVIQKILTSSTVGIGRPNLNAPTFEAIQFDLPSLHEQKEIVLIVGKKLEAINRLDSKIEAQLKTIRKQKQSILASAFSGKLV